MDIRVVKAKRYIRKCPRAALHRFVAPAFNSGQVLTFFASVIGLALYLRLGASPQERDVLATQWAVAIEAFGIALLGWGAISLALSPFLVHRDERKKGDWLDRRRIYFEPLLVGVSRFEVGGGDCAELVFEDAEPNSLITYQIRLDPPGSHASSYLERRAGELQNLFANFHSVGPKGVTKGFRAGGTGSVRLIGHIAYLRVQLPPNSVPVTARVYMTQFEV